MTICISSNYEQFWKLKIWRDDFLIFENDMYNNNSISVTPEGQVSLEVKQRGMGRLLLGAHARTANEGSSKGTWYGCLLRQGGQSVKFRLGAVEKFGQGGFPAVSLQRVGTQDK